jgi:hypothetical protein
MSAPTPDLKPHVPPTPPGSEACGCCEGITAETPQNLENRPGLPAIAYRIGNHAQFRASVHASLSSSQFAQLARLRTRNDNDFTIGLIDAFACAADVLTFYQERIANESYLRTAVERVSLQELGKLVGYRLRPGLAAETSLAFALETPPTPPPTLPPEPGNFVTGLPQSLALDAGLQVQSVPGPSEKPQTFETTESLAEARAAWNSMRPWMSEPRVPTAGDTEAWLAGTALNLKRGDALLFVGAAFLANLKSDDWDFRLIDSVEIDSANECTHVTWKGGLGSAAAQVQVLRKRAAVFGHNAPVWRSMNNQFRDGYTKKFGGAKDGGEWPKFTISPDAGHVDLDAVFAEVRPGSFAVLAKPKTIQPDGVMTPPDDTAVSAMAKIVNLVESLISNAALELYKITSTTDVSRAEFAISGKITRLGLDGQDLSKFVHFPRETSVYLQSEQLALAAYPVTTAIGAEQPGKLPLAVPAEGLQAGRRLIVKGERLTPQSNTDDRELVHEATLVDAQSHPPMGAILTITPPLPAALKRDTVVVHANVVRASLGETVSQIFGSGDASAPFQRFELKQLPLTYRAAANESGARSELTVRVADIAWAERQTLFGATPTDRAYTLNVDEQGRNFIVFGDGVRGARLPSGVNNVRATYRKGLGVDGNVAADKLTQLITRPLGLKSVSNPLAAEGGTDPEPASAARLSIPLTTRTLGRAVSLLDYEDFARGFSGIAKAQAQVLHLPGGPTIAITIAGPGGAPLTAASPVWINLLGALKKNGDPHVAVILLPADLSTFQLGLDVKCDAAFKATAVLNAVEAALRGHFAFATRELGQPVQQSEVIAVAHTVPGVVAVDITHLYGGTQPLVQTSVSNQVRLLASRMRVQDGVAFPAELLTLDSSPFEHLEEMA